MYQLKSRFDKSKRSVPCIHIFELRGSLPGHSSVTLRWPCDVHCRHKLGDVTS